MIARTIFVSMVLALVSRPCLMAEVALVSPKDRELFETLTDAQIAVFAGETRTNRLENVRELGAAMDAAGTWRAQRPLTLKWRVTEGESGPWRVRMSKQADFSDGGDLWLEKSDASCEKFDDGSMIWTYSVPRANLELGVTYYWQVWSDVKCSEFSCGLTYPQKCKCGKSNAGHVSPVSSFRTSDRPPRWIALEGRVENVRDLGGWRTECGGRVRTGLVYRGAGLNDNSLVGIGRGRNRLMVEDVRYMTEVLGIKTDIDLRGLRETAGMKESPLGPNVSFVNIDSKSYAGLFTSEGKQSMAKVFRLFCDKANYPIYFHCIHGADRTGSLAYVLNGVLGVSTEDLERDWESSFYPKVRGVENANDWRSCSYFDKGFSEYGINGEPLSVCIRLYLRECGVTDAEIETFKAIMKE